MFENVNVGDRIHLIHRASESEMKLTVMNVGVSNSWISFDEFGNLDLFADDLELEGWELEGAETKTDRIVKEVMKSLTRGPLSVRPGQEEEYKASQVEKAIRAALEAEDD